jgi:rubrerythrin
MIEIDGEAMWRCRQCGCSGEQNFSWDGQCLVCEDEQGEEDDGLYEQAQMGGGWK